MNTFSEKITSEEADKIKELLLNYKCTFDVVPYSKWRAKSQLFQVTYYESGKILVQGRDVTLITDKIKSLTGKSDNLNEASLITDCSSHIGTDESGKGDFFGPLVIAGVCVDDKSKKLFAEIGVKDSKKLDDKKIKQLALKIKENSVYSSVVIMPQKYNELYLKFKNLNKLLAWGHARAIENILDKTSCEYALADKFGDESLIQNALMTKGRNIKLKQAVRAEADIAVAAASVLARAEFVKRMEEIEEKYMLPFSKGASSKVVEQAQKFVEEYSFEKLNEVAKMHFKTVNEIRK